MNIVIEEDIVLTEVVSILKPNFHLFNPTPRGKHVHAYIYVLGTSISMHLRIWS